MMGFMQQNTVTLFVAAVGTASAFGGVVFGRLLGHRERNFEQWVWDQRKREFGDVLAALERSLNVAIKRDRPQPSAPNQWKLLSAGTEDFCRIVRTRIFTAVDMHALSIEDRWKEAIDEYCRDKDVDMILGCYDSLKFDLVEAAMKQAPIEQLSRPE